MTADWIIAEADRLIGLHDGPNYTDRLVRKNAGRARLQALEARSRLQWAVKALAYAEVAHKGYGDVDTIADRILNGVSS